MNPSAADALRYPYAAPPAPGEAIAVAGGILWTRLPLPFRLDHVNVYLIEDEGGFAVLDTGVDTPDSRAAWEKLFVGALRGKRLTKIIVTHFHPDHIGLAGWLCRRFDAPIYAGLTTYLSSINISIRPDSLEGELEQAVIPAGLGVQRGAQALDRGVERERRGVALGAPEQHVLDEVGQPVVLAGLESGPHLDE